MKTTRREFLGTALFAVGAGAAFTVCGKLPANIKEPISRPPGVLDEDDFLSKCMRCKQCIYICQSSPEAGKVLFAAKMSDGFNVVNTPLLIEANGHECTACGLCATVCPSGAIAKVVPQFLADKCIGCFKCIPACPNNALTEGANGYPALNVDLCVGCEKCVDACIAENGSKNTADNQQFPAIAMTKPENLVELPASNPNRMAPQFLADKCVGCFKCVPVCPEDALSEGANGFPALDVDKCIGCGDCKTACETIGQIAPDCAIAMVGKSELKPLPDSNPNRMAPQFLADVCIGCFKCISVCPEDALSEGANGYPALNTDLCIGCGDCRTECENANGNENGFPAIEMVGKGDLKPLPDSNPNKKVAYIDPEGCIACAKRICFKACTYGAISYDESVKKSPCIVDPAKCTGCGDCVNSARPCEDEVITLV